MNSKYYGNHISLEISTTKIMKGKFIQPLITFKKSEYKNVHILNNN